MYNYISAGAFFDCFIMLFAWHYNADDGTWIHPLNETLVFSKESSKSLTNDQGGHENFWRIMRRVQDLDLTFEERVIAASLCLTLSGKMIIVVDNIELLYDSETDSAYKLYQ